jgi:P-type conjugative transfer protein TrbG
MTFLRRAANPLIGLSLIAAVANAETPNLTRPGSTVAAATAAARVQPRPDAYQGAVQTYAWTEGGLYQVYTAPGRITDIVLEPGEQLIGPGPIAAGDTVRWVIGDTESGSGPARRVHVLVKPTLQGLATNLLINTDRRTYYLELRAATAAYMASVAWAYPKSALIASARGPTAASTSPPSAPIAPDTAALSFDYRVTGARVDWRPQSVFDDGDKTYLVFPASVRQADLPPLFLLDAAGKPSLVNYRIDGRRMIVDRRIDRAELRLGDKRKAKRVRIERVTP